MIQFDFAQFFLLFFGTTDLNMILAGGLMCLGGWLLSLFVMVGRAVKKQSNGTPTNFSWSYFWSDSWLQLVGGLLCAYALLRFSSEVLGANRTVYIAFILGFANMTCVQLLRAATDAFVVIARKAIALLGQNKAN